MINKLTNNRAAEILLVEDNENDVELTRIGFKKSKLLLNLHHAKDGVECMDFLRKQGALCRRSAAGLDPARPEHAAHDRPGGAGGNRGRQSAVHSAGNCDDHFDGRRGNH